DLERRLTPPQEIAGMSMNSQAAPRIAALAGSPCLLNGFNAARIVDQAMARDAEKKKRMEEPVTLKGLQALSNSVGQPTGKMENIPIGDLYFLWGLERVAMIYDFETIGGKDWYRWGAEMLLANLKPEGYWDVKTFGDAATEVINSSFALLFLRQANLAEDLTSKLREDPTVLDRPVVKKEAPAEARTAAAPTPPPAPPEAKKDPEKSGLASLANPKGAAAPESVEKATAKPPPPMSPQQPAPGTPPIAAASPPASSTPPAARESN